MPDLEFRIRSTLRGHKASASPLLFALSLFDSEPKFARYITSVEVSALLKLPICSKRVYDAAGNVIETHEHTGDFKEC